MKIKKSFTLIEVVVVLGIILFALPALFSIVFVVLQQQTKIYRLSRVKQEGDFALSVISNTIRSSAKSLYRGRDINGNDLACRNFSSLVLTNSELCAISPSTSTLGGDYFCLKDKYGSGSVFNFYLNNGILSSASALLTTPNNSVPLVTDKVYVTNLSFVCSRTATHSPPLVTVSFDICYNNGVAVPDCNSSRPEETATLHYQTNIKLTSF